MCAALCFWGWEARHPGLRRIRKVRKVRIIRKLRNPRKFRSGRGRACRGPQVGRAVLGEPPGKSGPLAERARRPAGDLRARRPATRMRPATPVSGNSGKSGKSGKPGKSGISGLRGAAGFAILPCVRTESDNESVKNPYCVLSAAPEIPEIPEYPETPESPETPETHTGGHAR